MTTSRSAPAEPATSPHNPPRAFWIWLAGLAWTSVGINVLSFGLVWAATDHSAALAGLLLLVVVFPRATLSRLGGAIADRLGPARVMLGSDVVMTAVMTAAALVLILGGRAAEGPALLITAAAAMGVADAFYQPSAGAIPKFLVPAVALPRAVAARQLVAHASGLIGPILGGVVVSLAGLPLSFALGAAGFAGMIVVLVALRRQLPMRPVDDSVAGAAEPGDAAVHTASTWRRMRDGLEVVADTPVLRGITALVAAFAAFIIPVSALLVPVLARAREWDASVAGTIAGAYGGGVAVVAVLVMWRRGFERAGLAVVGGMLLAGSAVLALAAAPGGGAAVAAGFLVGVGTGVFVTHLGPIFVAAVPPEAMARAQAVLLTAQSLPLLVVNPALGAAAERLPPGMVIAVWGGGAMLAGLLALASPALRGTRRPQ